MTAARSGAALAVRLELVRAHPRHIALFALVAGLACGGWAPAFAVIPALAALGLAGPRPAALAAVVAALGGAAIGEARRDAVDHGTLPAPIGAAVDLRLVVLEPLRERAAGRLVARAAVAAGPAAGEAVLLRAAGRDRVSGSVEPGDVVAARGRLVPLGPLDEFQRRRGALAALEAAAVRATGRRRGGLAGALDGVRRRAERGLRRAVPQEQAALIEGMVLGRDDRIGAGTRDDFRASGLAHLLAVSGTNVMLLATLVLALAAVAGVPLRARLGAALVVVALYVPLTGAGPSIQRAGVMGAAGLVAALAGRPASRWYALGLAAAVTLAMNPYALGEPGWQLSFAAVSGLLWLAPGLRQALLRRRVPGPLAEAAALTVAATAATAPLLAVHFEQVSVVSLPANLVVAPVVAPVMWLGMLAAAVAQIAPAAAAPLNLLSAPLVGFVDRVAEAAARVPLAVAEVHLQGAAGALLGYAALGAGWLLVRTACRRGVHRRGDARLGLAAVVAAVAVLSAAVRPGAPPALAARETAVSFLDVGQGDATLIQRDGAAVLFDTGPPDGGVVDRLRSVGVERLDALVITHAEADHEGAALPVLDAFRPRLVVNGGQGWPTVVQRGLGGAARRVGARVVTAAAGDVLRFGALEVRVLWPPRALAEAPPGDSANGRALVTHVRSGRLDVLLTADAEAESTPGVAFPDVEILKVAHHGSDDAGLPLALERLRPEVAAIMVGRGNAYGHPTPSTLAALRGVPRVFRTDRDGTVRLRVRSGRMAVDRVGT